MWRTIMIETLTAAADICDGSRSTSRAKSFRNLINRAIAASPHSAATAILQVFSVTSAPLHISETIGRWAIKFVSAEASPLWHDILAILSLEDKFQVTTAERIM